MAKKAKRKNPSAEQEPLPDNMLPQNILPIGERVEENKNIYISQQAYKDIHSFTQNKTTNESGGMLVGTILEEFDKTNIMISGFVEAKYSEGTPTTLKFTHETWEYIHKEIDEHHPGKKIVGWIHTHPDFGIFLSEYDKFIQQNFFSEDYQVAFVVDPIQNIEGFYFWINGSIEKCKGFYLYDETGVPITIGTETEDSAEAPPKKSFDSRNFLITLLSIAVAFLFILQLSMNRHLMQLRVQQNNLIASASQSFSYLQQQIAFQSAELQRLKALIPAPEETPDSGSDGIVPDDPTEPDATEETAAVPSDPQETGGSQDA